MSASATEIRDVVLARVAGGLDSLGIAPEAVPDDFDILVSGAIDSFGFLELIGDLETTYGVALDFETAEDDDLTSIGPFSAFVAAQIGGRASTGSDTNPPVADEVAGRTSLTPPTPPTMRRASSPRRAASRVVAAGHRGLVRTRDKLFSLAVSGSFASFGSHTVIQLPVRLSGERRIAVGRGCFIGASSWLQVLGPGDDVAIAIGDGASIAGHCVISAARSIVIGRGVSIARGVYIADHAHEYADSDVLQGHLTDVEPVSIGDGVWLAENVVVLPGVRIGSRVVIGANSVVASDIPDGALALGAPARVVRRFVQS